MEDNCFLLAYSVLYAAKVIFFKKNTSNISFYINVNVYKYIQCFKLIN